MMDTTVPSQIQKQSLMELLKSMQREKQDADLIISNGRREGAIHVRAGAILSAHFGILHGNGAILTLAQMNDARLEVRESSAPVQKTVFFTLEQAERFLSTQKSVPERNEAFDEEHLLQEARDLFFRFEYRQASEKLIAILRNNRFFYPAWLWQSRLLTRQDHIAKALDEAYRWGNHDQEVWREARKMRPQFSDPESHVHRCMFCWSILTGSTHCDHCGAFLSFTNRPQSSSGRQEEIRLALSYFGRSFTGDNTNHRTAFALALGNFNLGEYQKAAEHLQIASKLSPQTTLYGRSLSLIQSMVKPRVSDATAHSAPDGTAPEKSILIVDDSMTSRKVLSMLFGRLNCRIVEAGSGAEAIEAARLNRPGVVLLDLMLPDTDGHSLLGQLRDISHLREVPVIMLTGRHDANDRLKGIQAGVCEYLTKPFNPQKLTALVQGYLDDKPNEPAPRPQPAVQHPAPPREEATPQPVSPAPGTGSKSILIIEDSRTSRKVLSMILGRNGYKVYEASSGQEALKLAQSIRPDLVLLDVMLPDMTGYAVLPQLKEIEHFADLPIIMLTGNRKATDRMKGMLAGSNEYLTKPFDPQKLLAVKGGYN